MQTVAATAGLPPRSDRARLATMFHLASNVIVSFIVPLAALPSTASTGRTWVAAGLVAVYAVLHGLVLRGAVSPWMATRTRDLLMWALVAVTALAWPLMMPIDDGGPLAWAWLTVFTIGAVVLVWRPVAAGCVVVTIVAADVLGAVAYDEPWPGVVLVSLLVGGAVAAAEWLAVWMFRVLLAAEAGREAEARLAVAEERLRFARDLHDVIGHRLTVIALKAELAGSLADVDPRRVVAETEAIRTLAGTALREVRETVHDVHTTDVDEQLRAAELVLTSAGVRCTIHYEELDLSPVTARFLGSVVREGVTKSCDTATRVRATSGSRPPATAAG
ncbi:sensor histidine kinase [Solicola gregarius]|uniref:Histidine kinase dimerization/phosphoacceptor domain-containing protein n=1 Tax=Solicola gregarius TaxID=2908642 RepID=A0AA46TKS0_9ACTN|nr:histidine kinase dimerization/phosphoacceptor domain-containing protein [Solicola gregarius]UYM06933.1 histidine kinase dimerization/phosphoacceptor domain-containing protein [Solicola gregarius]